MEKERLKRECWMGGFHLSGRHHYVERALDIYHDAKNSGSTPRCAYSHLPPYNYYGSI